MDKNKEAFKLAIALAAEQIDHLGEIPESAALFFANPRPVEWEDVAQSLEGVADAIRREYYPGPKEPAPCDECLI